MFLKDSEERRATKGQGERKKSAARKTISTPRRKLDDRLKRKRGAYSAKGQDAVKKTMNVRA